MGGLRLFKMLKGPWESRNSSVELDMRIYFAHALCTYGYPIEKAERKQIRNSFPRCKIIDPGSYEGNPEKSLKGMNFCYELIDTCDMLVFSRLLGKVTSGVGVEIRYALSKSIRVYELHSKSVKSIKKPVRYLSREKTRHLFRVWRRENTCRTHH